MGQRIAIIGFALAVIAAIFLFTQQQQALKDAQVAQTAQAESESGRGTAVAQADAASAAQAQADANRAAADAAADKASTAQAEADTQRETAVAEAKEASNSAAQIAAAATKQSGTLEAAQTAAALEADQHATADAQSTTVLATAQAQIDAQATTQTGFDAALGTATAQVDLAEFARQAAEEDRATALAQFWVAATIIADQSDTLATAQVLAGNATPLPPVTPTPAPPTLPPAVVEPTATEATIGTYTSNDNRVTFNYPPGWLAGEVNSGIILVVNSQAILQRSSNDILTGEVEIQLIIGPAASIRGVAEGAKPADVAEAVRKIYDASPDPSELGETTELRIGQYAAARMVGTEGNNAVAITAVDLGDGIAALTFAYTFPGEMEQNIQDIDDILASLQYQAG